MKRLFFILFLILPLFLNSCKSVQDTQIENQSQDSVYVFDEVISDTIQQAVDPAVSIQGTKNIFVIQIGAFKSKENADEFLRFSARTLDRKINIVFDDASQLHILELDGFQTRGEAEKVRNELWKKKEFSDAFIKTVTK